MAYFMGVRQFFCNKETTTTYHPLPHFDRRGDNGQDKDSSQEVILDFVGSD
jgi:hypothetical protein